MNAILKQALSLSWIIAVWALYFALFPVSGLIAGLPALHSFGLSMRPIEHILCLALFIVCANGWAGILWGNERLNHFERFLFATGAGLGVMSFLVLFFNLIGVNGSFLYFFILISGMLLFIAARKNLNGSAHRHISSLLLIALLPLLSTLIGALAPPTQFDSLVYHLALPARYLKEGGMFAVPENMFFSFPQGMEMLFQMGVSMDSDILANLLHWAFLPLSALAIFEFCRRFWDSRTGLAAAAIWLMTPSVMFVSTGTYVDLAAAFYVFMSMYAFLLWKELKRPDLLYLSAVLAGLACGVKYTAAVNVMILGVLIAFTGHFRSRYAADDRPDGAEARPVSSSRVNLVLKYLIIVFIIFLPWSAKNLIFLKNPIAPWGTQLFASSAEAKRQAAFYFSHIAAHGVTAGGIKDLLFLPWDITFHGYRFGGGFDILGPVFLVLLPILFLRMKIDRIEKILLSYCLIFILAWILTGKVMRFLIPILPFACIFAARSALYLIEGFKSVILKKAFVALIAVLLAHNLLFFHWVMASVDPYSQVIGGLSREQYLTNKLNYFSAANISLNRLGPAAKTVFLGETRSYYCTGAVVVPTDFDVNPLIADANSSASPKELLGRLKSRHITHVFVNGFEFDRLSVKARFTPSGFDNWQKLRDTFTKLAYQDKFCELYEINN